jgi:hypothetical protein
MFIMYASVIFNKLMDTVVFFENTHIRIMFLIEYMGVDANQVIDFFKHKVECKVWTQLKTWPWDCWLVFLFQSMDIKCNSELHFRYKTK